MALVDVGQIIFPSNVALIAAINPSVTTAIATLDAVGEYSAVIFQAREAMTISHVGFVVTSATGSPTADVRIETVDAGGLPSGTLWAVNSNAITATIVNGPVLTALTASASINAGDWVCVKIVYNSGTSFIVRGGGNTARAAAPYLVNNTSGSPVKSSGVHAIAIGSSATTFYYVHGIIPASTSTAGSFSNSVAGAKRGLRFKLPFRCRLAGAMVFTGTATGDFTLRCASDAGAELSNSGIAYDGDFNPANSQGERFFFDNPVLLDANTWYRIEQEPTTATNCTMNTLDMPSADYMSAMGWPGGNAHLFTYTTAGGYVDSATNKWPIILLLIDQLYNAG